MKNILEKYDDALQAIYKHVGFTEDYVVYPFNDCSDCVWDCDGRTIKFADNIKQFNSDGDYYTADVYTQRFYKKHVYEGKKYTMIFGDPHTDGMKYFYLFDNSKRIPNSKIVNLADWIKENINN